MKDNQIINENWFDAMTRRASESFDKLTIRKPIVKHIPIEIWSEIKPYELISSVFIKGNIHQLRNQGGRTYLVITQEKL